MPTWMPEKRTEREYRMRDGSIRKVRNEYQSVTCPHCQEDQYCRLTHIVLFDRQGMPIAQEYHNNYNADLECLQALLVTYLTADDEKRGMGVTEEPREGKWVLVRGGEIIGTEMMDGQGEGYGPR